MANRPLWNLLKRHLKGASAPIVVEATGTSGDRVCPAASLFTGALALSERLAEAGVQPGDRIAGKLPNGVEFVQAMLACWRLEAVWCPINQSDADADVLLRDLEARIVFGIDASVQGTLDGAPIHLRTGTADTSGAVRFWTSGTSGERKSVLLQQRHLVHQIEHHQSALSIEAEDLIVSFLPWSHAFGGVIELLTGIVSGATILLPCPNRFELARLQQALSEHPGAWLFTVPGVLEALLDQPGAVDDLVRLRGGIVGGAPISSALAATLTEWGIPLRVGYGQTECSPGVTLGTPGQFDTALLGRPLGCEVNLAPDGEILVRGGNVSTVPPGKWHATGDLGAWRPDGQLEFRGRKSHGWKKPNGRHYHPGADEEAIAAETGVPVILLKGKGATIVPVFLGAPSSVKNSRWHAPVWLPNAIVDRCRTSNGKVCRPKVAEQLRALYPTVPLDPVLYPPVHGLRVGPSERLTAHRLAEFAEADQPVQLAQHALETVRRTHEFAAAKAATDTPIYGWKTGFGPHVEFDADEDPTQQGYGLICHLQAGQGPLLPRDVVRAMLALRLHTVTQGWSGVSPETVEWVATALNRGLAPAVPTMGSVGASGDLIPMAHAMSALLGEGEFLAAEGGSESASKALGDAGLEPVRLPGRDALAFVNGTPLMSAAASLAAVKFERQMASAIALSGLLYDLLGCIHQPLEDALHRASGHETHRRVAHALRSATAAGPRHGRTLQEPYSLRCVPQLLGAALTSLDHTFDVLKRELNGVSDNPLFDVEGDQVIHGGNFFGQEVAFAADTLSMAVVQVGNLLERQLALLIEPVRNNGLPLLLSPAPGAHSGLAGVQLSATATVAEMRRRCLPASVQTLPTNGLNQDIVPLGTHAAINLKEQVDLLDRLIGSLALAIRQAYWLEEKQPESEPGRTLLDELAVIPPLERDRPLASDVRKAADIVLRSGATVTLTAHLKRNGNEDA